MLKFVIKITKKFLFGFNTIMEVTRIQANMSFRNNTEQKPQKREIIDVIVDKVKNPRDVNDCVAVPRGIFKAYMALMAGTGLMAMSNYFPKKANGLKNAVNTIGWGLNILSAYYFAKPFAFKGLSPTVKKEEII